jgi:hypothetical protein
MKSMKLNHNQSKRRGLILLIVLGMLALFSLLAVTYVVSAGSSRNASKSLEIKARANSLSVDGFSKLVLKEALRGTNNQKSPFFGNSLIGDIFGPNALKIKSGPYDNANSVYLFRDSSRGVNLVKIPLEPAFGYGLSPYENEYNSRILTMLEGPLAGQSFRILKYIGFVGNGLTADPNIPAFPWSDPTHADPNAASIQYSVVIDLNEVIGSEFTGEFTDQDGTVKSVTQSIDRWLAFGAWSPFFFKTTPISFPPSTPTMTGYKMLLNDAAFNSPGIGLEDIVAVPGSPPTVVPGFGNLDARRLLRTSRQVPLALLPHYDYLQDPVLMSVNVNGNPGVDGFSNSTRDWSQPSPNETLKLEGWSNEGIDVADYRDAWLANQTFTGPAGSRILTITPSYHRPEVVHYLSHLYGDPYSLSYGEVTELLRLIDASTGRVLSYPGKNEGFRKNDPTAVRLRAGFTWSSPPTAPEVNELRAFVLNQILGPWDLDNNGDSIADGVWMDPSMPMSTAPDGRRLRPLVVLTIEDLDNRINLNTSGDRVQGCYGFEGAAGANVSHKRSMQTIPQGFGYGPAEISLTALTGIPVVPNGNPFNLNLSFMRTQITSGQITSFSFFDLIGGASRPRTSIDRMPGIPRSFFGADPSLNALSEREFHIPFSHAQLPGLPIARRGSQGVTYDKFGNLHLTNPIVDDVDPYSVGFSGQANETLNDKYESAAMGLPISDDPLGLAELEAVIRRFDEDSQSLPQRIRTVLNPLADSGLLDSIYSEVTTRSGELRYPNLAAAMKVAIPGVPGLPTDVTLGNEPVPSSSITNSSVPSYLRYIQMLHSQRYRAQTFPPAATDDPVLSYAALAELFPTDFARGLRMDLNRPFGNGFDDDGDGQVDEPQEVTLNTEREYGQLGFYIREIKTNQRKLNATVGDTNANANPFLSETRNRLGARQIFARNLYCLGQLLIPRDYEFPGMASVTGALNRARFRATAIAQWAVNVVDFRDADSAMTRFEFDILPFGSNSGTGLPVRGAYWAPDRIQHFSNRDYVGVVWGMEQPELLLTETLAIHDTRIRDTNLDTTMQTTTSGTPDNDFDQFRNPQASLFIEMYNPRTTTITTDNLAPGVASSLYTAVGTEVRLNLSQMAPTYVGSPWGSQPVWRIAISERYIDPTDNPQSRLGTPTTFRTITHQRSIEGVPGGTAMETALTGVADIDHGNTALTYVEQHIGSDLRYDLTGTARPPSVDAIGFERFIWFSSVRPTAMQMIPDILPSIRSAGAGFEQSSVYSAEAPGATLAGGSYMVIGPRSQTNFGSLTHNQFTGYNYTTPSAPGTLGQLLATDMAVPANRPVLSPSYQRIDLSGGSNTYMLNNELVNSSWTPRIKTPETMICSTTAPAGWDVAFPGAVGGPFAGLGAVGINISYPRPNATPAYWAPARAPTTQLNTADLAGTRADSTPGFGTATTPPDSWMDVSTPTATLPDTPYDMINPLMTTTGALPATDDLLKETRTLPNVRAAYLQRLADPEFAYDPVTNPYITVDWMSIDLTIFNGEAPRVSPVVPAAPVQMQSRYKDGGLALSTDLAPNHGISYYSPMTAPVRTTPTQLGLPTTIMVPGIGTPVDPTSYCMIQLGFDRPSYVGAGVGSSATTLGYCNVGYPSTAPTTPAMTSIQMDIATFGDFDGFGPPLTNPVPLPALYPYQGAPARIANVTWFNRPFASPYEIMMVPLTSPGQFGLNYSAYTSVQNRENSGFIPSYQTSNAWSTNLPAVDPAGLSSYWGKPAGIAASETRLADWPLLLEFLETQPGFVDANYHYDRVTINNLGTANALSTRFLNSFIPDGYTLPQGGNGTPDNSDPSTVRGPSLLAPFNMKPSFIAAGKVNLNTISFDSSGHSRTLRALEYNYKTDIRYDQFDTAFETSFEQSRRGYDSGTIPPNNFFGANIHPDMHPDFPTRMVGAFRPAMSSNLAPTLSNPVANDKMRSKFSVESTLLRSAIVDANTETAAVRQGKAANTELLFQATDNFAGGTDSDPDSQIQKNNFLRMQRAMRLPNLVTNQSNVFAVWVTVSLFEYDPIKGYGNEYVGDNGLPKRERQFFIVDRTIPVGFKQGEDLNVERTILLQRILP